MAYFRPNFQIFVLFTIKKSKYNHFLMQHPWQDARYFMFSKRNQIKDRFDSCKKPVSIRKPMKCKKQILLERKKTLWEYIFGLNIQPDSSTCLEYCQKKMCRKCDPRLHDLRYQNTAGDVLIYSELIRCSMKLPCTGPQPKSPPQYKVPRTVLCKMMAAGLDESQNWDHKAIIPESPRKPYEEMKPPPKLKEEKKIEKKRTDEGMLCRTK